MATHLGICTKCAKTKDCIDTTQDSMCLECFHAVLRRGDETIASIPEPGRKVWILAWSLDPLSILSIQQVIYTFDERALAEEFLAKELRPTSEESLSSVTVQEFLAIELIAYCLRHPGLKVLSLARGKP